MSTFPDRLYHLGGVPVGSDLFFSKTSKVYFVDGLNGADGNDGLSINFPFKTVAKAIAVVNARIDWAASPWATGDMIYIMPGTYAENLTSLPYGATMIGMGHDVRDAQVGVKIKPATGHPVNATSVINTAFYNIGFESADASEAFDTNALNNCYFKNCFFSGAAESTTCTEALEAHEVTKTTFDNCWFCNAAYGIRFEYVDAGDAVSYCLIDNCIVTGVGTCGIYTSTNLVGPHSLIRNTHVGGGGQTLTTGINDLSHIFEMYLSSVEATTAIGASGALRGVNGSWGNGVLLT